MASRGNRLIVDAERLNAPYAISLIHSFSQTDKWFADYEAFVNCFGRSATINQLIPLTETSGITLYTGWARGNLSEWRVASD